MKHGRKFRSLSKVGSTDDIIDKHVDYLLYIVKILAVTNLMLMNVAMNWFFVCL